MKQFIAELQERGVLRAAGLYAAIVWLMLQASDVLFPAFEIPDSAVKILLGGAAVCFPLAMAFAWFYEITDKGIQREEDIQAIGARRLMVGNEIYFIIIGILLVALSISLYMNFQDREAPVAPTEPISLLISDFDNQTGDSVFDGSVEQALTIGVEGASFITSYSRNRAAQVAKQIGAGDTLAEESARLVALREGIKLVISGAIMPDGGGYQLNLTAIDARDGTVVAEAEAQADDKSGVLVAVGELALQIRENLGDVSIAQSDALNEETLSAASLDAVSYYTRAQELAHGGNHAEAISFYERAIAEDPNFGRAYSGWALSEYEVGHLERAQEIWQKTLPLLNGMTEREKYRSLGLYYIRVTNNYEKAIENYGALVEQYPADDVGHNNLAVSYFMTRQFDKAMAEGGRIRDIYPSHTTFRTNYALYAMYAGDFATARAEAEALIADGADYFKIYLPIAMAALSESDFDAAVQAYHSMAGVDARGASLSSNGLADLVLYQGQYELALTTLDTGIAQDNALGNTRNLAAKEVARAEGLAALGREQEAVAAIDAALDSASVLSTQVPSALLLVAMGETDRARAVSSKLARDLQAEPRAYGSLIDGALALESGDLIAAVDALRASVQRVDLWLARLYLGRAYMRAEHAAEALSEFEICQRRLGEATALFLDDIPTFRYARDLNDLIDRARQQLNAPVAAGD